MGTQATAIGAHVCVGFKFFTRSDFCQYKCPQFDRDQTSRAKLQS